MRNFFLLLIGFFLMVVAAVNFFLDKRDTQLEQVVKLDENLWDTEYATDFINLKNDSLNPDLHYQFIRNYADTDSLFRILKYYNDWLQNEASLDKNMIYMFLGYAKYINGNQEKAFEHFENVDQIQQKYYHYILGVIKSKMNKNDEAVEEFYKEVELEGYVEGAYEGISLIYQSKREYEKLAEIINNPLVRKHVPVGLIRYLSFKYNKFFSYFSTYQIEVSLIGFIAAFLVMLTWLFYLRRIDIFQPEKWLYIIIILLLGMIFSFGTLLLSDILSFYTGFSLNGGLINDFFYCVIGIGAIEELVKFIPVLIMLKVVKVIDEPVDYIIYASVSALGFGFIENLIYFKAGSESIIHGRALVAVVSHMIDSSIIAYGLILSKYKKFENPSLKYLFDRPVLTFFVFYLLASIAHGYYDFWLINPKARVLWILTFLFFFAQTLVWISFINNALNNSTFYNRNIKLDMVSIQKYLFASLVGVLLFEYVAIGIVRNANVANLQLIKTSYTGGFLIIFLVAGFSNFDVVPNYWAPINFTSFARKLRYNEVVSKRIVFRVTKDTLNIKSILPLYGRVVHREVFSGITDYFVVHFEKPIFFKGRELKIGFIKTKLDGIVLKKGKQNEIYLLTVEREEDLQKKDKDENDLRLVDKVIAEIL